MLVIIASLAVIFFILVGSEVLWRRGIWRGERVRKLVHVLVGSFVAFWPWLMTWRDIEYIALAFLAVVGLSKVFKIFHALTILQK